MGRFRTNEGKRALTSEGQGILHSAVASPCECGDGEPLFCVGAGGTFPGLTEVYSEDGCGHVGETAALLQVYGSEQVFVAAGYQTPRTLPLSCGCDDDTEQLFTRCPLGGEEELNCIADGTMSSPATAERALLYQSPGGGYRVIAYAQIRMVRRTFYFPSGVWAVGSSCAPCEHDPGEDCESVDCTAAAVAAGFSGDFVAGEVDEGGGSDSEFYCPGVLRVQWNLAGDFNPATDLQADMGRYRVRQNKVTGVEMRLIVATQVGQWTASAGCGNSNCGAWTERLRWPVGDKEFALGVGSMSIGATTITFSVNTTPVFDVGGIECQFGTPLEAPDPDDYVHELASGFIETFS